MVGTSNQSVPEMTIDYVNGHVYIVDFPIKNGDFQ